MAEPAVTDLSDDIDIGNIAYTIVSCTERKAVQINFFCGTVEQTQRLERVITAQIACGFIQMHLIAPQLKDRQCLN